MCEEGSQSKFGSEEGFKVFRTLPGSMKNMPNPDRMRRLGQVEVGMEQLSLDKPGMSDMDVTDVNVEAHVMELTDVPDSVPETMEHPSQYMPDVRDAEGAMDICIVLESVPDTSHKRRRK